MANLKPIDCSQAFSRFLEKYRLYNESCETLTHTRKKALPNGNILEIVVHRKTEVLPEQIKTTFYMILQKYAENYNYISASVPANLLEGNTTLPALLTNNVRLAEYCDCSDKTIYNHRTRLKNLGVISSKFRGRKSDFELWITPEILFGTENETKTINRPDAPKNAPPEVVMKSFTHNNMYGEKKEKENRDADMLICGYRENSYGERGRTDTSKPIINAPTTPETESQQEGAGGRPTPLQNAVMASKIRNTKADQFQDNNIPALPPRLEKYFANMLMSFWMYAWKMIYEGRDFSKQEQEKAIEAIYVGVFNRFEDERTAEQWVDFQTLQLQKIDKAAKYYDNHPDAYRPDPYAVHIKGKGYFDIQNTYGFVGLDAWVKKDQVKAACRQHAYQQEKHRRELRAETLLKQARKDFERLEAGVEPRKEVKHKTHLQLWNYYYTVFSGLGNKYTKMFAESYLAQQANGFKPQSSTKRQHYNNVKSQSEVVYVEQWMTYDDGYYS